MNKEDIGKYVRGYFLLKALLGIAGVVLYLSNSFSVVQGDGVSYFSFLFGDLALFRASVFIPVFLAMMALFVYYGIKNEMGIAKLLAIILLIVDVFSFPVGTIVSVIFIGLLVSPYIKFQPIAKENVHYRAIGLVIIAFSVVGLLLTTGMASDLVGPSEFSPMSFSPQAKILSEEPMEGEVEVIITLDVPTGAAGAQAQNIFIQNVQALGGEVVGATYVVLNSITTKIDSDNLLELAANPMVKEIIPNEEVWFSPQSVDYKNTPHQLLDNSYSLLNVEPLWKQGITGEGVVVAIVDTGINSQLPAFQRDGQSIVIDTKIVPSGINKEYVMWHGTAVASCVASQDESRKGTAPGVDLLNVMVFLPGGGAKTGDILAGWEYVASWKMKYKRPVVCCNSLGAHPYIMRGSALDNAANNMVLNHGIPMVVAAGNMNPFFGVNGLLINSPGRAKNVLTVGAVDDNLLLSSFSCRGGNKKPDVVAPGENVNMFHSDGRKFTSSGTSFATPLTAGCLALIMQGHPEYSATQIQNSFKAGAMDLGTQGYNTNYGYGLVNAEVAEQVINGMKPEESYTSMLMIFPLIGVIVLFIPELKKYRK